MGFSIVASHGSTDTYPDSSPSGRLVDDCIKATNWYALCLYASILLPRIFGYEIDDKNPAGVAFNGVLNPIDGLKNFFR